MELEMSLRKSSDKATSCNSCGARNYKSAFPAPNENQVDTIFELRVGMMCNRLCRNCLNHLSLNIAVVLGAE